MPAVFAQFAFQLALAPAGIAERKEPVRRPLPGGDRAQHIGGKRQRPQRAGRTRHVDRALSAPVRRMQHEAALRFDRAADVDRRVGRAARIDPGFLEHGAEPQAVMQPADPDAQRAVLVMDAERDHSLRKTGIKHARQSQQQAT